MEKPGLKSAIALLLILIVGGEGYAQSGADGLFRSRERFIGDTSRHTKWTGMLARFEQETFGDFRPGETPGETLDETPGEAPPNVDTTEIEPDETSPNKALAKQKGGSFRFRDCLPAEKASCREALWRDFLQASKNFAGLDLLDAVNRFHNQAPYITDLVNWGVADYWETLGEYFLKDGDCEDYAISKYISLKQLGWPVDTMRIAVIRDENLRIPHAVLVVYHNNQRYVLDNQAPTILTDDRILHYRPVFSINETGWWHHIPASFGRRFR